MTREEIIKTLQAKLPDALGHTPVVVAYLFGSWAKGEPTERSDEDPRVNLEVGIRLEYFDFKPRLKKFHRLRLKAFAEKGLSGVPRNA